MRDVTTTCYGSGQTPPVRAGQSVTLTVSGLNHDGDGVGRVAGGFTVFVPGALPGEAATATITEVTGTYARAELAALAGPPSPDRTAPVCPVFGRCGGCQLQHMTYSAQLSFKRQRVADALARIGRLGPVLDATVVSDCLGSPDAWHYRNKARFLVDGEAVGFRARRSHRLVDVRECPIQSPTNNKVLAGLRRLLPAPGLREVEVRSSRALGQAVVSLVVDGAAVAGTTRGAPRPTPELIRLAESLRALVPEVSGVTWVTAGRTGPQAAGGRRGRRAASGLRTLLGDPETLELVCGLTLRASPASFLQVNPAQAERLYDLVAREASRMPPGYRAYDLYSGVGIIALVLATAAGAGAVTGVEALRAAVDDARLNAEANHVWNASFVAAPVESFVRTSAAPTAADGVSPPLVVVVDPPRAGCEAVVLEFLALADLVVYVSCDAATLARDLGRLLALAPPRAEHARVAVHPVDMFPQTAHIECVAIVERRGRR